MPQKMVSFAADCLSTIADENTVVASYVKRPKRRIKEMSSKQLNTSGLEVEYQRLPIELFKCVEAGTMKAYDAKCIIDAANSAIAEAMVSGNGLDSGIASAICILRSALPSDSENWYLSSSTSDSLDMEKIGVDDDSIPSHVTVTVGEEGVENGVGDQRADAVVFNLDTGFANRKASV